MKTIALCLLLALCAGPVMAEGVFKDVPKDHWAAESVNKLAQAGIIRGYPDGTFKGDKSVTRYELAAALSSMIQFILDSQKPLASGQKKSAVEKPMEFLKDGGYLPKDSPVLKDPGKTITPEELAQALSSVAARLIEARVPAPKESESPPEPATKK